MQPCDSRPNPANIITHGNARFTLLTGRMLRLEWAADGRFEDRATLAVVHRALPGVRHRVTTVGRTLTLTAPGFTLTHRDDGKPFSARNLRVTFSLDGRACAWWPGRRDARNLGATLRTLDGIKGGNRQVMKEISPGHWTGTGTWKPVDMGQGLVSRSGWALVDDSASVVLDRETGWVTGRPSGERYDGYLLLHGHDYRGAVADAARVFGRQPLPPRYVFGYWWSRYWAYTDRQIENLVRQFEQHQVPLDVMVVDMDWHLEGWTGYTWDHRYFPDPAGFLRWLKERDLKITLNLHPADGVQRHEVQFDAMSRAMGLPPGQNAPIPFDCTDPRFMEAYFRILHHPDEKAGVDFWWMDWQQGSQTRLPGLDPLPWLNHLHWQDMERNPARRGRRPLIFSRFGGIGAGRYCVGFSGDTFSVWDSLAFQPYFTATAANVLYGYWSHDIGGHMPGPIEPELYTRWMQFGAFSPVLRTHTSKHPEAERRVWAYPDPYGAVLGDTIRLRYEMIPYIYTAARRGWETGLSLCRPMYYDWPGEQNAYAARHQYMFGEGMLVAPVLDKAATKEGLAPVRVWLPDGAWFDCARGCREEGGGWIRRRYAINEIPVFVRPGTIVPGQCGAQRVLPGSYRDLMVTAYPGGGTGELYEDDGVSADYTEGGGVWIPLRQTIAGRRRQLKIGPARGDFRGFAAKRRVEIRLPATPPPRAVKTAGRILAWTPRAGDGNGWSYDGDTATTVIHLTAVDLRRGITVSVEEHPDRPAVMADGLKGLMTRLAGVDHWTAIALVCLVLDPQERLAVETAQTGNRLSRAPSTFETEIGLLGERLAELPRMLRRIARKVNPWNPEDLPERAGRCARALAILRRIGEDAGLGVKTGKTWQSVQDK